MRDARGQYAVPSLSPADRARWIAWAHARIARLDGQIAQSERSGFRHIVARWRSQRECIARNLAIYEAEVTT